MALKTKIGKKAETLVEPEVLEVELAGDIEKAAPAQPERTKKGCFFCQNNKLPNFTDSVTLRRFMSDRSRIVPKLRSGVCSKHQRLLTREIKYARHLALLPFVPSV